MARWKSLHIGSGYELYVDTSLADNLLYEFLLRLKSWHIVSTVQVYDSLDVARCHVIPWWHHFVLASTVYSVDLEKELETCLVLKEGARHGASFTCRFCSVKLRTWCWLIEYKAESCFPFSESTLWRTLSRYNCRDRMGVCVSGRSVEWRRGSQSVRPKSKARWLSG